MAYCGNCGEVRREGDRFCGNCGAPTSIASPPRLGGYDVLGVLGRGATGTVYLALDPTSGERLALKVFDPVVLGLPGARERLNQEVAVLASLRDTHLVGVRSIGEDGGRPFVAMDFVEGASLREIERRAGRLSPEQALGVLEGALRGLSRAHGKGIVHGDVKPENILVDREGTSKLVDFGHAFATQGATAGGTPAYMSPEACRDLPQDRRSDLYSLGVVLYEALSGHVPFQASSDLAVLRMHVSDPPPPIERLPRELGALLARALSKDPDDRPQSADAFLADLAAAAADAYGRDWRRRAVVAGLVAGATAGALASASSAAAATPPPVRSSVGAKEPVHRSGPSVSRSASRARRASGFFSAHVVPTSVVALLVVGAAVTAGVLSIHARPSQSSSREHQVRAGLQATASSTSPSGERPTITNVAFSGAPGDYTVTVTGAGFGTSAVALPYTGDTADFRIGDNAQLGDGEWGYTGDANPLAYDAWTNTHVQVSRFGGAPGDSVVLALWNPQSGSGAVWGGNVPPSPSAPHITSVRFSGSGKNLSIEITGSGFGTAPVAIPFSGDLNDFYFWDARTHCTGASSLFSAGGSYFGARPQDTVTLDYTTWTNTKIVVSGFGGTYGNGCASVIPGDPVALSVWLSSATTVRSPQTSWGGVLQPLPSVPVQAQAPLVHYTIDWTELHPHSSPPAQSDAPMAYDAASRQLVYTSGWAATGDPGQTWLFNGTDWTVTPSTGPPGRAESSGAYDAASGQYVLFGGCAFCGAFQDDTWAWSDSTWTQEQPTTSPPARDNASLAYDPVIGKLVLFGGSLTNRTSANDTWEWNGTDWSQVADASDPGCSTTCITSPPPTAASPMTYDATSGQMILFDDGETWDWNGSAWTQLFPRTSPSPAVRSGAGLTYDPAIGGLVLFGGSATSTDLNDVWIWNGVSWSRAHEGSSSAPSPRESSPMAFAYDPAMAKILLFGGFDPYPNRAGDTWVATLRRTKTPSRSSTTTTQPRSKTSPASSSPYTAYVTGQTLGRTPALIPVDLRTGASGNPIALTGSGSAGLVTITGTGRTAYIPGGNTTGGNVLKRVDLATGSAESSVTLPGDASMVALTPRGTTAYVVGLGMGGIAVVDVATATVNQVISMPDGYGIATSPNGASAYVASYGNDELMVADLLSGAPGPAISVEGTTTDVAVTPNGKFAYVTSYIGTTGIVTAVNLGTDTAGAPISVPGGQAYTVTITSSGKFAYVGCFRPTGSTITPVEIATNRPKTPITIPGGGSIALTPAATTGYVPSNRKGAASLVPIDLQAGAVKTQIPVTTGVSIGNIAIAPRPLPSTKPTGSSSSTVLTSTAWSSPRRILSRGVLSEISCAAAGNCTAVGGTVTDCAAAGCNTIGGDTFLTLRGTRWSRPKLMEAPFAVINAISCPTPTFCAAAGFYPYSEKRSSNENYVPPHHGDGVLLTWNGRSWSQPQVIGFPSTSFFRAISCATATFCVATDADGDAFVFNGSGWQGPEVVEAGYTLDALSCPTQTFCMVVDANGNAVVYKDGTPLPPTDINDGVGLQTVACTTRAFCVAIGQSRFGTHAYVWNDVSWSSSIVAGHHSSAVTALILGVACPSSELCIAVGGHDAYTFDHGQWSTPKIVDRSGQLVSVSCPSIDFCAALDSRGSVLYRRNGRLGGGVR